MAITFDPSSLDFGFVPKGAPRTLALKIKNSSGTAQTVTLTVTPAGKFGVSPISKSVPANGEATVNVEFTATAEGTFAAALAGGGGSCALSGDCIVESSSASIEPANKKYLLFRVPDFADGEFEVHARNPAQQTVQQEKMESFLRLGSFDYNDEPPNAKSLLKMIHQCGSPGDPTREQQFSWDEEDEDFATVPPLQSRTTDKPASRSGNTDVFFKDDVRIRDVDVRPSTEKSLLVGHGLTMAQRQKESGRLYSRGGWRDHSDGNRISTTYGDKVEVVRGNYKMIVLGRQDSAGEAMGWEVSGSHVTDYAPGTMPGAGYWLQWVPDYKYTRDNPASGSVAASTTTRTGVWLLVNTTENVYEYARKAGNFREETWGNVHETYTGSENPPPVGQWVANDASQGSGGHHPPAYLDGLNYHLPLVVDAPSPANNAAPAKQDNRHFPPWAKDNKDQVRTNPHIIEKTWARRIDAWTGSEACLVPEIHEKTFAEKMYSDTGSSSQPVHEIRENTFVKKSWAQTGSSSKRVEQANEETWAEKTFELVDVSQRIESNTRAGSIFEATTAGTIWESTTSALHIGLEVGVVIDTFFGAKTEFDLAAVAEWSVISHHEVKTAEEKKNLKAAQTCLKFARRSVSSDDISVESKTAALSLALKALSVHLGV